MVSSPTNGVRHIIYCSAGVKSFKSTNNIRKILFSGPPKSSRRIQNISNGAKVIIDSGFWDMFGSVLEPKEGTLGKLFLHLTSNELCYCSGLSFPISFPIHQGLY